MYKKFLCSLLLTVALSGCNQQPSDKQGDQSMDAAMPVQQPITNSSPLTDAAPVDPSMTEPTQTSPTVPKDATQAPGVTNPDTAKMVPPINNSVGSTIQDAANNAAKAAQDAANNAGKAAQDAAGDVKDAVSKKTPC